MFNPLIQAVLPQLYQTKEFGIFIRGRNAIGSALDIEHQVYLTNNFAELLPFLETEKGQKAVQQLVTAFKDRNVEESKIILKPE